MLMRKFKSLLKRILIKKINFYNKIKLFCLEENISFGKKVSIGKNVTIRTTDGGGINIMDNVTIEANTYIYAQNATISIGKNTFIGFGTQIVAKESIIIGDDCLISAYSIIRDANHGINKNKLISKQEHDIKPINIDKDVWIGSHSTITAGVKISQGVVVAANAVVTKDIAEYTVVGGVPAKFIKNREG